MDFNADCRIYAARAYADIPTSVLGVLVSSGDLPAGAGVGGTVCNKLPVKREAIEFEA